MKRSVAINVNQGHWLVTGMTGSGKSVLSTELITESDHSVLVGDPKGDFEWPQAMAEQNEEMRPIIVDRVKDLERLHNSPRIIYRPNFNENENPQAWGAFFRYAFERKRTRVYLDEIYHVTDLRGDALIWFKRILTRGRSSQVFMGMSSQRPTRIPMECITESSHIFVFQLHYIEDRRRLAMNAGRDEFMETPQDAFRAHFAQKGIDKAEIERLVERDNVKFGFWYYKVGTQKPQLFSGLNIAKPQPQMVGV